jgi:hypothetical protein
MQKAGEGVRETQGAEGQLTSSKGPEWGIIHYQHWRQNLKRANHFASILLKI